MRVQVNRSALNRIVTGAAGRTAARHAAEQVADAARAERIRVGDTSRDGIGTEIDLPVEVHDTAAGASVVLAHPAGVAVQAKHGTLTRAASSVGLKVQGS